MDQRWEMLSGVTLEQNVRAGRWEELPVIFLIKVIHGAAAAAAAGIDLAHARTRLPALIY